MQSKKPIEFFPIRVICSYLLATVALYAFGPIEYNTIHPILLYSYLLFSFLLLYLGYRQGVFVSRRRLSKNGNYHHENRDIAGISLKWYSIILLVSVVLLHLTLYARTGSFFYNFNTFSSLGTAYIKRYLLVISRGRSYIEWLRILLSPITLAYFPIGVICWKKINRIQKFTFIYLVIGNTLSDLITGTNKGFADTIIYISTYIVLALVYSGETLILGRQLHRFKKGMHGIVRKTAFILLIFMITFSLNISSRLNKESLMFSDVYKYIAGYFSQGYKAVDYTFDQPFESTYGFGFSMYLLRSTPDWFGTDSLEKRTYLKKNEETFNWNQRIKWSSIYVWLGNDFSLWGALFVIYLIGRFFGKVWIEAITKKEISSIVLSALMIQLCFYIPANNQIVQTAEGLSGVIFWLTYRKWKMYKNFAHGNIKYKIVDSYDLNLNGEINL